MTFIREYWEQLKKQNGQVIVLTALLLPLFIAATGLTVDFGNLYVHKARLQNAADAAALAGGHAYSANQPADTLESHPNADGAADASVASNMPTEKLVIKNTRFGEYKVGKSSSTEAYYYRVRLTETVPIYFLKYFTGIGNTQDVGAEAFAKVVFGGSTGGGDGAASDNSLFKNLFTFGSKATTRDGVTSREWIETYRDPWSGTSYGYWKENWGKVRYVEGLNIIQNSINDRGGNHDESKTRELATFNGKFVYAGQENKIPTNDFYKLLTYDARKYTTMGEAERHGFYVKTPDDNPSRDEKNVFLQDRNIDLADENQNGTRYLLDIADAVAPGKNITVENSQQWAREHPDKRLRDFNTVHMKDMNYDFKVNDNLSMNSDNSPLYYISYANVPKIEITTQMTTKSRPIVYIYTGTTDVWITAKGNSWNRKGFRGIICAPNATVHIDGDYFDFYGSIIANTLDIQVSQGANYFYDEIIGGSSGGEIQTPGSVGLSDAGDVDWDKEG